MTKANEFTLNLSSTTAGVARIWIEGKRLEAGGWTAGTHFKRVWADDSLTLKEITKAEYNKLERSERGTVSGKPGRPIIDIASKKVGELLPTGVMHVKVNAKSIVIV